MDSLILYDDKELFKLISEGQKTALTRLFKKYSSLLSDFAFGLTKSEDISEEVLQETFMRLWFNREKLIAINDPKLYIFRTVASVSYKFLKLVLVDNQVVSHVRHETFYSHHDVAETTKLYSLAADIQDAIRQLEPEQKKVYKLSRQRGLKIPEIAEELSLSPNGLRNILNSAVESIHDHILDKGHTL